MPVRIIGCGNSDRGDDAAGLLVARRLRTLGVEACGVQVIEQSGESFSLLDSWTGFEDVILVDATVPHGLPGKVRVWNAHADTLPEAFSPCSTHGFGVREAVELARALNRLPQTLLIYGIEGKDFSPGASPSPEVEFAVETVTKRIVMPMSSPLIQAPQNLGSQNLLFGAEPQSSRDLRGKMSTESTRREFLKLCTAGLAAGAAAESAPAWAWTGSANPGEITVWVSDEKRRFEQASPLAWRQGAGQPSAEIIALDPEKKFQEILGFGAAFTDAACYMFSRLPSSSRESLFHELFHPSELGLNVCRTCIGASDYSTELYSFDEGEPDPDLKRFSVDHDRAYILPSLRQARQENPDMFLFSTPWSPPGWMKSNGSMLGGCMGKRHYASYAQYFLKFLQAYADEGVSIQAVTSQNEVDTDQDGRMPACLWGQEYEIEFVKEHLGPVLRANGIPAKIWLLDHNYNLWGRAICELDDPGVREYANAVAWHGYAGGASMASKVHDAHPDVEMHWTEGGPDYTQPDYATDWAKWGHVFTGALRNWCQSITGWNLALDEQGRPNIGPFPCGGVVTIHSQTKEITRSGQYWAFAHFSRLIHRGAHRFDSQGVLANVDHVACENSDGQRVLVLSNTAAARPVVLRMDPMMAELTLESNSLTTLTWK